MNRLIMIPALLALAACAGKAPPRTLPETVVETVEVKVAVPVPCAALTALGPEPSYPDSDSAIAAEQDLGRLAKLYVAGRLLRTQRLAEYAAAKVSCVF